MIESFRSREADHSGTNRFGTAGLPLDASRSMGAETSERVPSKIPSD